MIPPLPLSRFDTHPRLYSVPWNPRWPLATKMLKVLPKSPWWQVISMEISAPGPLGQPRRPARCSMCVNDLYRPGPLLFILYQIPFLAPRKVIRYSMDSNGPEAVQVVHTRRTPCRRGWPREFGALNSIAFENALIILKIINFSLCSPLRCKTLFKRGTWKWMPVH